MVQMQSKKENAAKAIVGLTIFSFVNKVLGLLRESALAAYFGASSDSDAYKLAYSIPSILLALISTSIATTFIPVYTDISAKNTPEQRNYFVSNFINIFAAISIVIALLGYFCTPYIVRILAIGFSSELYRLTVELTKLMMVITVLITLYNCFVGFLNAEKSFYPPVLGWTIFDIVVFLALIVFNSSGIKSIALWTVIATLAMFLFQIPSAIRNSFRFRPHFNLKEPGFLRVCKLILPITFSSAISQLYMFTDRMLASRLPEGSISSLDYASRINWLIYNIFILSLITVVFPELTINSQDLTKFKQTVLKSIRNIWVITVPGVVLLFVLSTPIVKLVFERGSFDTEDTRVTALALTCYSIGSLGLGMRELFNRAFYAIQDTKTPVIIGVIVVIFSIFLSIILANIWGVSGLATAVTLTYLGSGFLLGNALKKTIGKFYNIELVIFGAKLVISALLMAGIAFYSYRCISYIIDTNDIVSQMLKLSFSSIISFIIYVISLRLLNVEEITSILKMIQNKTIRLR